MLRTIRIPARNIPVFIQNIGLVVPDLIERCSVRYPVIRSDLKRCFNELVTSVSEYKVQLFFQREGFYVNPDEHVIIQYYSAVLTRKWSYKTVEPEKIGCVSIW